MPGTGTSVRETVIYDTGAYASIRQNVNGLVTYDTATWDNYVVVPGQIKELVARVGIYQKFKILKVEYQFKRDISKLSQFIAGHKFRGISAHMIAFPNTFNNLVPEITAANQDAVYNWAMQQTKAKKIPIGSNFWKKTVRPLLIENTEYAGPSGVADGGVAIVAKNVKYPWLDLENDLLDNVSCAQMKIFTPIQEVNTLLALRDPADATQLPGVTIDDIQQMLSYRVYCKVTFAIKGRFLSRALV